MEQYEPFAIIQKSAKGNDHFDVTEFKRLISELDSDAFDKFCKRIAYLAQFSDTTTAVVHPEGQEGSKDPVAKWDAKGIDIDNSYENPSHSE